MIFGNPHALWLFLVVPFYLFLHVKSFSDMGPFQRNLSLLLRMLLITSLIFSLADAKFIKRSDKLSVLFLWDKSRSMGEINDAAMWDYIHEASDTMDDE